MSYDLLPYSWSSFGKTNELETTSHIALTTMALDIKEAGRGITSLMAFLPNGMELLKILKI